MSNDVWEQTCSWVGDLPRDDPDHIIKQHYRYEGSEEATT
jgi:hypothetical protein